jgi:hypothetical protein
MNRQNFLLLQAASVTCHRQPGTLQNSVMLRIPFSTAIALLFFVFNGIAQDYPNLVTPSKVTTIGYWNNGKSARYHVIEKAASYKGKSEKPFNEASSEYDIRLKVTDSTATSYDFEMIYTNYKPDPEAAAFIKKVGELAYNVPIRYRTDELGVFDTILNLEELQKDLVEKLELCRGYIAEEQEKETAEIFNMVFANMMEKFKDLENVEALYIRDILTLHGFYGFELQLGKPLDIELFYPTIGDVLLTGTGTITLNTINKTKDECIFSTTEKPNRDELKEYMGSLALMFMLESRKKISLEELNMTMSTKKKMKMELSTGWMNSVVLTSTVKLTNKKGDQKKVSTISFERK